MIKRVVLTTLLLAFAGNTLSAQAQFPRPSYPNDRINQEQFRDRFQDYLNEFQRRAGRLKDSIKRDVSRNSSFNDSRREDDINQRMDDFKREVDRLRDRFKDKKPIRDNINAVVRYRSTLENIMSSRFVNEESRRNWTDVRSDLDRLERLGQGGNNRFNQDGRFNDNYNGGYNGNNNGRFNNNYGW